MKCNHVKEQFVAYLKNELDNPNRTLVEQHIDGCEYCCLELNRMKQLWTGLENGNEQKPSAQLSNRFYDMLNNEVTRRIDHLYKEPTKSRWTGLFSSLWPSRPQWALSYTFVIMLGGFLVGQWMPSADRSNANPDQQELAQIKDEVSDLRDLMAFTLLSQDSVQARLQGVDYARENNPDDPRVLTLLLNTFERDEARNVRLAALDALGPYMENPAVNERIYNGLLMETSPIVQLKIVELLLDAAGTGWQEQLDELLKTGILDSNVTAFLQDVKSGNDQNTGQDGVRAL